MNLRVFAKPCRVLQRWFRRGIWNFHIVFSNQFEIQFASTAHRDERKRREKRSLRGERTAWIIARIGPRRAIRPYPRSITSTGPSVLGRERGIAKSLKIGRFSAECAARPAAAADQTPRRCVRGNGTQPAPAQTLSGRYSTPCGQQILVHAACTSASTAAFAAILRAPSQRRCCAIPCDGGCALFTARHRVSAVMGMNLRCFLCTPFRAARCCTFPAFAEV